MKRFFAISGVVAALAGPSLRGQGLNSLSGPTQGIVFDGPSRSLRQVAGSFGSAVLGPALVNGLDFASMSEQGTRGVVCQQEQCFLISGDLGRTLIGGPVPNGAAWSADGQTAALYSTKEQWIQVIRGMEADAPQNLASLGGELSAVEVSPDGQHIVFAMRGEHPGVYELTGGSFVPVLAAANPAGLAYSGTTLYVLDGQQISEVAADGIVRSWPIDGVQDAVDLQPGHDAAGRSVIYVAGGSDHSLFVYDAASHALNAAIPLTFSPSQVQPSGVGGYLLTSRDSEEEILWAFSAGRGVFFVPVTPEETPLQRKVRR